MWRRVLFPWATSVLFKIIGFLRYLVIMIPKFWRKRSQLLVLVVFAIFGFLTFSALAGIFNYFDTPVIAQSISQPKSAKKSPISPEVLTTPANSSLILPNLSAPNLSNPSANSLGNPPTNPRIVTKTENWERPEVILENRGSGCRAIATQTPKLQANLCPKPNVTMIAKAILSDKQILYPLPHPTIITSGFGWRVHPISGKTTFHQGVDLGAAEGTPVFAAYSGNVEVADWLGGLGKAVVLSHGYGTETRYGHLSQILVNQGQAVKQGTVIGLVGSTGMSTGAHLHFELWQRNSGEWSVIDATNAILGAVDNLNRYLQSMR
jgi:murein DD-endopeptidase MepM/ murein hydrolase activator NlpD